MYVPSTDGPVDPRSAHAVPPRESTPAAGLGGSPPPVLRLFDLPELEQDEPMSDGRRRTARWHALLEAGTHPATGRPLDHEHTCATCVHHVVKHMGHDYHKCRQHTRGITGGPASDIRAGWPACTLYESSRG